MNKPDLMIIFCSHRIVTAPTAQSLENLRIAHLTTQIKFNYMTLFVTGDALIGRARSIACSRFLSDTEIPYMLFIDDDIVFKPEDVQKIYDHMVAGYDIVGGLYPVRGASQFSSYGWGGKMDRVNGIQDIEYLATGFMGISRKALIKIRDECKLPLCNPDDWSKCYPFFESKAFLSEQRLAGGDNIYISEDWWFCELARKVGFKIYCDDTVQLGHMREEVFTGEQVVQQQTNILMQQQVYGAMMRQSELMRSIDTDIGEFLGMPASAVRTKMNTAQQDLAEQWHKTTDKGKFYNTNQTYLFDLAVFNQQPHYYQQRLGQLLNIKGQKILDIGCGIGTTVFMMSEQGNDVTGWDINKTCIDFCEHKKKKYVLQGNFTLEKPDFSEYNLIIAIDVLEHIEGLEQFLLDLGKTMKQGTKFYHSDYFPRDKSWPMHHEENATKLPEWLNAAGLIPWDDKWAVRA